MDIMAILELISIATNVAAGLTQGKTKEELDLVAKLEEMAAKVAKAHMDLIGQPIDPDSLKYEEPIT